MDQDSRFYQEAKSLLNDGSQNPYSDKEIKQIITLLDVFANAIYDATKNS
jgi:hypothetical protein